MTDSIPK